MKSTTLFHLFALPAAFATLLGVDIVGPIPYRGLEVRAKKESADGYRSVLTADKKEGTFFEPQLWCLKSNQWTEFCNGRNTVQVLGHINFTDPTREPRLISMYAQDLDTDTTWTAACNITVTGGDDVDKVVWDMTKLEAGLLDSDLNEGFKTDAIKFDCGEGWVNPERESLGNEAVTFTEAFSKEA